MDLFLYFFVIPIAIIISAIALQKLLNSPILVGALIFIVSLIIALTAFGGTAISILIAIIYGFLGIISAWFYNVIRKFLNRMNNNSLDNDNDSNTSLNTCACRRCRCQRNILRNLRI